MTNYNQRLDKILGQLMSKTADASYGEWQVVGLPEAKQAITSRIKELVAEAKPDDFLPEGHEPDACLNHEKYTSACCGCQRKRARAHSLDEFEQNLLKALEEV